MSNFFERVGTEIEPSLVNSNNNFISSSSNLCNVLENVDGDLIYVGFVKKIFEIAKILEKIDNFLKYFRLEISNL